MSVEPIPEEGEGEEELSPEEARRRFIGFVRSQPEILLCLIEEILIELNLDSVEFVGRAVRRWLRG